MVLLDENQGLGGLSRRIFISETFPENKYDQFRQYCDSSKIYFVDELQSYDYVAFQAYIKVDSEFVREIREKADAVLSGKVIIYPIPNSPESIRDKAESDSSSSIVDNKTGFDEGTRISALHIVANKYMDVPLDVLNLSVRLNNTLRRGGIATVGNLLFATDDQLKGIKQIGNNSLQEIHEVSMDIINNYITDFHDWKKDIHNLPPKFQQIENNSRANNSLLKIGGNLRAHILNALSGNDKVGNSSELTTGEGKIINRINQAIDVFGIELCKLAYDEPEETKLVIQCFQTYSRVQEANQAIQKLYSAIPEPRRTKQIQPYIKLFNHLRNLTMHDLLRIFSTCRTINEILENIGIIAEEENQRKVSMFLEWLSSDILEFVKPILVEIVGEGRRGQILYRRAAGDTLETISEAYGLTRERIRQIEGRAFQVFSMYHDSKPILLAISAELNGETIITSDDIRGIIADSEILLYLEKKHPDSQFEYDKTIDCFYLPTITNPDIVFNCVYALPKLIYDSDRECLYDQISQSISIPRKYLDLTFRYQFERIGTIWYKGKMSRAEMYSFVIEKYFPNGMRVYDPDDIARFKNHVREVFGDVDGLESDRALWARIQKTCILCDRGVYIHPSRVSIPDDLLYRIEMFFIDSGRTSMTFHELYNEFENELLLRANISNRYSLQGVLKQHFQNKYYFYRDGITTDESFKINGEIEAFIRENSPVSKSDLKSAFSGITDAMLYQNLIRLPSVIMLDNGLYMHADGLNITEDDYAIRQILDKCTNEHPISTSKLLERFYSSHYDFLTRNEIHSSNTLFSVLQYMFFDEFKFSRPYISSLKYGNTSTREMILSLLNGQECVGIAELVDLCEDRVSKQSPSYILQLIRDDFIRVDKDTLMSTANLFLTDEKLDQIKELVTSSLQLKGYLVFNSINNLIFYPDIGIPWTPFLLHSLIENYLSEEFIIIDNTHGTDITYDLVVDRHLGVDNYEDLIRSVIRSEHTRDPFKDLLSVINWLIDQGLLNKKAVYNKATNDLFMHDENWLDTKHIPKFITNGSFISMDEYGKLIII
jgi:hypothetical protein